MSASQAAEDIDIDDEPKKEEVEQKGEAKLQAAAMKNVTSAGPERTIDANTAKAAITKLTMVDKVKRAPTVADKIKALSDVQIKQEDLETIVKELDIRRDIAELTLREHKGNAVEAMRALLSK